MHLLEFYTEWLQHDGRKVVIDGHVHVLSASSWMATYPYVHQVISVHATPVCKSSKYYQDTKNQLGDDWSTDVLESGVELQADLLTQLRAA